MSLYKNSGPLIKRTVGGLADVYVQLKKVDFRPVKKVSFKFDPFSPNITQFRDLVFYLSSAKLRDTNPKCLFKTEIASDRSDPELTCKLENGSQLIFKAKNLTALEILERFNKIIHPLLPPEPSEGAVIPKTKSQKKR